MRGFNQVTLMGNLGADPEMRFTPTGKGVTTFSVACSRKYKNDQGDLKEETEWFNVVAWEPLAESCNQSLQKGDPVFVVGRLHNRSWEDEKQLKHNRTEVIAGTVTFIAAKHDQGDPGPEDPQSGTAEVPQVAPAKV